MRSFRVIFFIALAVSVCSVASARVVTWPAAEGTATTDDFTLSANGKPVDILRILAADLDGKESNVAASNRSYSAALFDADEKVTLKVSSKRDLSSVRILPLSLGISPKHIDAHTISFSATPPFNLSIEPEVRHCPLIVKACLPEKDAPKLGDDNVVYIGPGRHHKPWMKLTSGQTLYLAPGAWVEGSVNGIGTNITVRGRGVLSGNPWPWCKGPGQLLVFTGANVQVEGITLVGSWGWSFNLKQVKGATVSNIAVLGGRCLNDDGIDIYNSRDVTIRDSFFRTQDDCIAPKHCVENLLVENCQLWADVANNIRVGHENTDGFGMRNLVFRNIDVLHQSQHKASFDETWSHCLINMESSNEKLYSNIVFENFRIDTPEKGDNMAMLVVRPIKNTWHDYKMPGNIRRVIFRNFTLNGDIPEGTETILLWSRDADHTVEGIDFENIDSRIKIDVRGASTYRRK